MDAPIHAMRRNAVLDFIEDGTNRGGRRSFSLSNRCAVHGAAA
jgi:hypothetical protein